MAPEKLPVGDDDMEPYVEVNKDCFLNMNRLCDCAASIILCNSVVQTFVRSFVFPNCVLRPADRLL